MTVKLSLGQTVQTTVGPLTLDDRVEYEPSSYAYDPGWWATTIEQEYFISDEGIVYTNSIEHPDVYDVSCGKVVIDGKVTASS